MEWKEIRIDLNTDGIDTVSALLLRCGIPGFAVEDPQDFEDFIQNSTQYWDYVDEELERQKRTSCCIKFYVTANETGLAQLESVKSELERLSAESENGAYGSLRLDLETLQEEDWANAWKQYYKPFTVGKRLLVQPEWEEAVDPMGRIVFRNNPGMAFGSGSHATTRLCMEQLEKVIKGGEKVYDLGCGSGILSIIAALLGAREVMGIDIDPNAAEVAVKNAAINGIAAERCSFEAGNVITDKKLMDRLCADKADIVVANIVADVIISLTPTAKELLKPDGLFIASGIIDTRLDEVETAISAAGFAIAERVEDNGWCCIIAKI